MHKPHIMIVEDDAIIAADVKNMLGHMGYAVAAVAHTGESALEKAKTVQLDLILMDIKLSGAMSGIDTTRQIRKEHNIPVVYVTANADQATVEQAKNTEAYGFIYKPVQYDVLKAVIEMALHKFNVEKKVRDREAWLDATLKSIGDAVIATDSQGRITFLNPVAESLTGYKQEECVGKPLSDIFNIVNAKSRNTVENPVQQVLKSGTIVGLANHTVLISKSGKEFQIADSASPIFDAYENIQGVVLVFRDVTEEYRIRQALKENEAFLIHVFNSIQDGISILDKDLTIRRVNQVMEDWYSPHSPLVGKKCFKCYQGLDVPCDPCPTLRSMESGKIEFNVVAGSQDSDSPVQWIELYSYPMKDEQGEVTGVVEFVRDITDKKNAEIRLRESVEKIGESEEKYRLLIENQNDLIVKIDNDGKFLFVSPSYCELFGKSEDELLGNAFMPLVHEADREATKQKMKIVYKPPYSVYLEQRAMTVNGWRWIGWMDKAVLNDQGEVEAIVCVGRDITEKQEMEDALVRSEDRLAKTLKAANDGMWDWDLTTNHVYFDSRYYEMAGYAVHAFPHRLEEFQNRIHPDDVQCVMGTAEKHLRGEIERFNVEFRFKRADDSWLWVLGRGIIVEWDQENKPTRFIGTHTDITERKQAEQAQAALIHELESKNAEMERFLYTVSHDLKSPLITIQGFIGIIQEELNENKIESARQKLETISDASRKMVDMMADLLDLSRIGRVVNEPEILSMNAMVEQSVQAAAGILKKRQGRVTVQDDLGDVFGDGVRIQEVYVNLIENAVKYTKASKTPDILIGKRKDKAETVFFVQDHGVGIAAEYQNRVFELFEKLNVDSEGSGVGLAVVKRIIEFHHGRIWVESEGEGKGSTFCFTLPVSREE